MFNKEFVEQNIKIRFSYYGLNRRVARALGVSENTVAQARRGRFTSQRISAAIEAEQKLMEREQIEKHKRTARGQ